MRIHTIICITKKLEIVLCHCFDIITFDIINLAKASKGIEAKGKKSDVGAYVPLCMHNVLILVALHV